MRCSRGKWHWRHKGRRELELTRIEAALKRLNTDEYGYCVSCDEDIALGRLKSDPAEPSMC